MAKQISFLCLSVDGASAPAASLTLSMSIPHTPRLAVRVVSRLRARRHLQKPLRCHFNTGNSSSSVSINQFADPFNCNKHYRWHACARLYSPLTLFLVPHKPNSVPRQADLFCLAMPMAPHTLGVCTKLGSTVRAARVAVLLLECLLFCVRSSRRKRRVIANRRFYGDGRWISSITCSKRCAQIVFSEVSSTSAR